MNETGKVNITVYVTLSGLEKCTAFAINKSFAFIDSKQFMNFSLEKLAKNLSDYGFKHLTEEF